VLNEYPYQRTAAKQYAEKWALSRNPAYFNFDEIGGDCTNFASQCVFAGSGVMNHTPIMGWFYYNVYDRAPAWTGVPYLHNFLMTNKTQGPFAKVATAEEMEPGDLVQFGDGTGNFYHCPVVLENKDGVIFVAAHSYDALYRPLWSYDYPQIRYLHLLGVRK
jgi:hypothetical protein